jgi:uncharacterized protein
MDPRTLSHVLAFDDAPFAREHRGDVLLVGVAFAHLRLEGVISGRVRRDGRNATQALATLATKCKFARQTKVIMLQGIAMAGFNVVDIHALHATTGIPVLIVMRRPPRMEKIRRALFDRTPGGARKWALVQRAGPPEPVAGVWIQRAGIDVLLAGQLIEALAVNGRIPEPLRVAHLVAGGIQTGESRGRA